MIEDTPKKNVLQNTSHTPSKIKKKETHNSTKNAEKLIEEKIREPNQPTKKKDENTTISKEKMLTRLNDENVSLNSNIVEKSDANTKATKSAALNIKKNVSPKKNWIANANIESQPKEESNTQDKTDSTNISPQKCTQKHNDTNINNLNNDMAERSNPAKTVVTIIKIQHNSTPNTDDSIDENQSTNKNLYNKDGPALQNSSEHTPQKLQKSPKKKVINKDIDENTTKNDVLHEMSFDIVKSETHIATDIPCDEITESNHNNEVVSKTVANVNIETLLLTPKRASEALDQIKIEICKAEAFTGSPYATTPKSESVSSIPPSNSDSYKKEPSSVQQTPQSSKKIKTLFESDSLKGSPLGRKTEKDRTNTDSECLSDTLKSELCDPDRINEFEAIDMLHDLDAVIDFEDSKISACALLSPFSYNCLAQDANKKPDVDPLFIDPSEQRIQSPINSKRKRTGVMKSQKRFRRSLRLRDRDVTPEDQNVEDNINVEERMDEGDEKEEEEEQEDRKDDIEKLRDLRVQLIHVAPPQHTLAPFVCVTRSLTHDQVEEFQKYGPLKKGKFSAEEDEIIKTNWKLFCKTHGLNPTAVRPFIRIRQKGVFTMRHATERQKFVQFLGNGLPWRSIYSIYNRFKQLHLCDQFKRPVPYTAEEDQKILSYVRNRIEYENMSTIFADLTQILGRSGKSLRARHKLLVKYEQSSNGNQPLLNVEWSLLLIEEFIKVLIDITLSESLLELKYASIPLVVWKKCEERMNIDSNVLKNFWYLRLHMQLFCKKPIYLNDVKITLIEYMYGIGASSTHDIIWPEVVKYFDGMTTRFLQNTFQRMTGKLKKSKPFIEIIETLYHEEIPKIQQCDTDRYLPRFNYDNGKLELINDNISSN